MAGMHLAAQEDHRWIARLDLAFERRRDITILAENRHSGPLRLQRPFYPEEGVCHAYVLHPPGGVVGGDRLTLNADVGKRAAALITTPGATKFYRSSADESRQENLLYAREEGTLEWLPQETIFFPGTNARTTTCIQLGSRAIFMGWEVVCLGLPDCGQVFQYGSAETLFEVYRDDMLLFKDRLRVNGESDLDRPAGMRGYSVCGTFLASGCGQEMLDALRRLIGDSPDRLLGITLMDDLLVARYLGKASFEAKALFQTLWTWLRPHLLDRKACPPRIWST